MSQALTPGLALDYVCELSADVRAAIVLDGAGRLLAGPPELAGLSRELLDAAGDAAELEAATGEGVVCAVRSTEHAAVAVCGRFAIAAVVRQDLRAAVAALAGRRPGAAAPAAALEAPPGDPLTRAAEALISAAQRDSEV